MALWNCNLSDDEDDDNGNGNSKCGGQDKGANTGVGNEPVQQDYRGEDDDNLSKDSDDPSEYDDTRALEWLPMCSEKSWLLNL